MYKLFDHQQRAKELIIKNNFSGAIFHEIGLGKTLTALDIYKEKKDAKLIVVCPLSLIEGAWGHDIRKFTQFTYINMHKNKKYSDEDIFIFNFESLRSSKKAVFLHIAQTYDCMIVIDESSKIKNHQAQITKTLLTHKNSFKYRIIASGTPAPNIESEYWPQMNFLDDNILGRKFYPFRNHFFHVERGREKLSVKQGQIIAASTMKNIFSQGFKLAITDEKRRELMSRMKPYCHFAKKKDCLDLPETLDEFRYISLTNEQKKVYRDMKNEAVAEIRQQAIIATVALTKLMKLRQVCSGFMIGVGGAVRIPGSNPKLNELKSIIEEAGDQPIIIWATFHSEIEDIKDIKEIFDEKACTLYGKTKDREDSINGFKSGKYKYLIAHGRSAGHGLTFVNCSLHIFYSLDYSYEIYEQMRGRTDRVGQKRSTTYIHLLGENTIDMLIYKVLKNKQAASEIVKEMLK